MGTTHMLLEMKLGVATTSCGLTNTMDPVSAWHGEVTCEECHQRCRRCVRRFTGVSSGRKRYIRRRRDA